MKRGTVVGIVVGVVVALGVGLVAWWLLGRPEGPEATARAYLDALESGDFAAIESLRAEPLNDPLVRDAFAGASERVSNARIVEIREESADISGVIAEVTLGGETHDLGFTVERTAGRWRLGNGDLGLLTAAAVLGEAPVGDTVTVGGALFPARSDLLLLPAAYEVAAAPRSILAGQANAVVLPGEPADVVVETRLSPDAVDQAQEQLDAYLDACAEPASEIPANCGIRVPWAADLTSLDSVSFRIEKKPVLSLSADASGFDATGGTIVATATGTSRSGGTGSFTYLADDWSVRGSVRFEGEQMVLSVR